MQEMPNCPVLTECCVCGNLDACLCGDSERALHKWAGRVKDMPSMTLEQREWCLREIGSVEGWSRDDHENDTDEHLANSVLSAWLDYCRDKGLL